MLLRRNKIARKIGREPYKKRRNVHRGDDIGELIAVHNYCLEAAMKQFPTYEFPVNVHVDIDRKDAKAVYHRKLWSEHRRKVKNGFQEKINEARNNEVAKTVQRLVARNRVHDLPCIKYSVNILVSKSWETQKSESL